MGIVERIKKHPSFILTQDKNGRKIVRKQTLDEKHAEKILQYIAGEEYKKEQYWSDVGNTIQKFLRSYKKALKYKMHP